MRVRQREAKQKFGSGAHKFDTLFVQLPDCHIPPFDERQFIFYCFSFTLAPHPPLKKGSFYERERTHKRKTSCDSSHVSCCVFCFVCFFFFKSVSWSRLFSNADQLSLTDSHNRAAIFFDTCRTHDWFHPPGVQLKNRSTIAVPNRFQRIYAGNSKLHFIFIFFFNSCCVGVCVCVYVGRLNHWSKRHDVRDGQ